MCKEDTKDLMKFLRPFGDELTILALELREFIWDLYPQPMNSFMIITMHWHWDGR